MLTVRELNDKEEMLEYLHVLNDLYPSLTLEDYSKELDVMLPHNYGQVAVFEDDECLGISGFWVGNKLWCGKYLELDNIVVLEAHRSKGVGKLIFDFLSRKAQELNCTMMSLDSYTYNFKAHKFFYNEGFAPRGFHFINILKEENIR
ncbi:MAG: GNAT family N-acetyltransferase [Flavobacteriales bacterium]|jgi:GNAT superfamily N-acetyltransferase|nr:GNAT family N-acetyltransferase [Crocinitomicaceae bacterium]NBX80263.1 GNAT family N-acetyltransferase [Flavobacteriales bacterium]